MASKKRRAKQKKLEMTVLQIQKRFGSKALRKLEASKTAMGTPHVPTGFSNLDRALGIGGVPRSRITEILGPLTSGKTTIALRLIAHAQGQKDKAAYIDLSQTFDPDYAYRCGVDLRKLLIVQPNSGREALSIGNSLILSRGIGVIVFDSVSSLLGDPLSPQLMSEALRQISGSLTNSACALIFLTSLFFGKPSSKDNYPSGFALSHYASIRLAVERERWIKRYSDVRGYTAEVEVIKNRLAPAGKKVSLSITFNGTVDGNGT